MNSENDTPRGVGCPIRISTDQRLLAAPHGFSQRATSFIASWCQGIHRMPFSRSRSGGPIPQAEAHRTKPPTHHAQEPATPGGVSPDCAAPPHGRHELSTHTGSHRSSHRPIPTPLNACAKSRGSPHLPCHHGRRTCRSDTATTARPATHQNLIHPDKDHIRHPTRDTLGAAPAGAAPIRCFTVKRPTPLQTANTLEAIGLEPTTPCLQSRCSPS